jgi:hypothetical protein
LSPIVIKTVVGTVVGYIDGRPLREVLGGSEPFVALTNSRVLATDEEISQAEGVSEYREVLVNKSHIVIAIEL